MSWSKIQSASTPAAGAAASIATSLGFATAVGHLVVVNVSGNATTVTLADSAGNTWTPLTPSNGVWPFYSVITNPGVLTFTATPNASSFLNIEAVEIAGIGPTSAGAPVVASGTGTTASSGSVSFTGNGIVLGATIRNSAGGTGTPGSGYTLDSSYDFVSGTHFGQDVLYKLNASSPSTPSVGYASSATWSMLGYAFVETPTKATVTGPTSGANGAQSTVFTVTLDVAAPTGGVVVTPASTGSGDTFQATVGGGNVTTITIAAGQTTGTFYLKPGSTSWRSVSITTSPTLLYPGSPAPYLSGTSRTYFSTVSGLAPGLSTVGYTVLNPAGTVLAVRTSNGVAAMGGGVYGAAVPLPFSGAYAIRWDDAGTPTSYGADPVSPLVIETDGMELGQLAGLLRAYVGGKSSGFSISGATAGQYLGADGATSRISGACDAYGNRTSTTLNPLV
jgi:hypothetical protein